MTWNEFLEQKGIGHEAMDDGAAALYDAGDGTG